MPNTSPNLVPAPAPSTPSQPSTSTDKAPLRFLVLDLDLTVFASGKDLFQVHKSHTLSEPVDLIAATNERAVLAKAQFINPEKLRDLIEDAYVNHDGIMILTAGCWDEYSVKQAMLSILRFSPETAEKFQHCVFLSTTSQFRSGHFDKSVRIVDIRDMNKTERLKAFIMHHSEPAMEMDLEPDYRNAGYVLLDNCVAYCNAFNEDEGDFNLSAVHATIDIEDIEYYYADVDPTSLDAFYKIVSEQLQEFKDYEKPCSSTSHMLQALSPEPVSARSSPRKHGRDEYCATAKTWEQDENYPSPLDTAATSKRVRKLSFSPDTTPAELPSAGPTF